MALPDDDRSPESSSVTVPEAFWPRTATASIQPLPIDEVAELARQVRVGLLLLPRVLPARWMLDDTGAALHDAWLGLPECGLGRAEARLLERHTDRIANAVASIANVVELGPGGGARRA